MATKARKRAPMERVRESVRRHPISWGTLAAFVSVLGAGAVSAIWIAERFQTAADARAHAASDSQRAAWATYSVADLKATILRNRVNECRAKGKQTPFEATVCKQYEEEFDDALRRARQLYQDAMATGKEK